MKLPCEKARLFVFCTENFALWRKTENGVSWNCWLIIAPSLFCAEIKEDVIVSESQHISVLFQMETGGGRRNLENKKMKVINLVWSLGLEVLKMAKAQGVQEITFYGFTTDNCKRPANQFQAFSQACVDAVDVMSSEGISLLVLGNTDSVSFPETLRPYTTRTDLNGGGIKG